MIDMRTDNTSRAPNSINGIGALIPTWHCHTILVRNKTKTKSSYNTEYVQSN